MRPASRSVRSILLGAAIAACAALLVAGCGGGDETITESEAAEIKSLVENARDKADNKGDCEAAEQDLAKAEEAISNLDLAGDAQKTAEELFARSAETIEESCVPVGSTSPEEPVMPETTDETTESIPTDITDTDTTDTDTDPEVTDETAPKPEEGEPPPTPPGPPETPPGHEEDPGTDPGSGGGVAPGNSERKKPKPGKAKGHKK